MSVPAPMPAEKPCKKLEMLIFLTEGINVVARNTIRHNIVAKKARVNLIFMAAI
jgi:hypothetical protein